MSPADLFSTSWVKHRLATRETEYAGSARPRETSPGEALHPCGTDRVEPIAAIAAGGARGEAPRIARGGVRAMITFVGFASGSSSDFDIHRAESSNCRDS